MRHRRLSWIMSLLLLATPLWAQVKGDPPTPAEQYQAILGDYRQAQAEAQKAIAANRKQFREAKTTEERRKISQEYTVLYRKSQETEVYAGRFMELAEKHPKDAAALDALVWVASTARFSKAADKALEVLAKDHIQSDKLEEVAKMQGYARSPGGEVFLRVVLEKSPHRAVRGYACAGLARRLKLKRDYALAVQQPANAHRTPIYERQLGVEFIRELQKADIGQLEKDCAAFCERVIKEFADLRGLTSNLGKEVEDDLFEVRHLSLKKTVPEVQGEDLDGKAFKLSDYRGKVVLIDFWGHW